MWQTWIVLLVVAAVLVYVIRYYVRVSRCEESACSGCSGGCGHMLETTREDGAKGP